MENRPAERELLQRRAEQALEDPASLEPSEPLLFARPQLRLWHYPAFFVWTTWMVFEQPANEHSLLARRVIWDSPYDHSRFSDPLEGVRQGFSAPPTLTVDDASTIDNALQPFLHELGRQPIPVVTPHPSIGLDGETFGFQSYGSSATIRLQWWHDGPKEWRPLIEAIGRIRDFLDSLFEASL